MRIFRGYRHSDLAEPCALTIGNFDGVHRGHRALLEPGERISLFEDLEDLESEQYDCEGKLQVLQRIYRTQPALLVGGGAAAAGARHFPGMHGIDRR